VYHVLGFGAFFFPGFLWWFRFYVTFFRVWSFRCLLLCWFRFCVTCFRVWSFCLCFLVNAFSW
jgi:hypothetical protein